MRAFKLLSFADRADLFFSDPESALDGGHVVHELPHLKTGF